MNPFRYGCVVSGASFCERTDLEEAIVDYANRGQNIVVYGERRIGKTSLVLHALASSKCKKKCLYIDLYGVRDINDIVHRVVRAINNLSNRQIFIMKVLKWASALRPTLRIDPSSGLPELTLDLKEPLEIDSIDDMMTTLCHVARDQKLCVVFDEFQDVSNIKDSSTVFARMRSAIQLQPEIPYFFLGSIRSEMLTIFTDADSAFYKSALPFEVLPIDEKRLVQFVTRLFDKGQRLLPHEIGIDLYQTVLGITGDVQQYCEAIWSVTNPGETISKATLQVAIHLIHSRELSGYELVLNSLTQSQLKVLHFLASSPNVGVYSTVAMQTCHASPSKMRVIMKALEKKKFIYKSGKAFRFFNPFFAQWLLEIQS